ncbi:hypothetical protein SAMN05428961_110147 [Paenibacillus sp. OK060]|nr:hypothetical protein SAMN05428961_110147 [Paenibacillus sp. OK060]
MVPRRTYPRFFISIHALHTECDHSPAIVFSELINFNPRTPYGVRRLLESDDSIRGSNFNPRTPYGVRRKLWAICSTVKNISIHALHTECDCSPRFRRTAPRYFNPRTPYGVRPFHHPSMSDHVGYFNPRTPYGVRPFSNCIPCLT